MAWIYLAELEESQKPLNHGLEQSLTVNKTDSPNQFYFQECQKESCAKHLSGMMCRRSVEKCCRQLTLFLEASHAKTLVLQEMEKAWQESEAGYSTKLSGLQKKLERRLYSWKTSQPLELADFLKSSEHLPKWGMTVAGRVYLPQALEFHTKGKDGFYLPTPTAQNYGSNKGGAAGRMGKVRYSLNYLWKMGLIPTLTVSQKGYDNQKNGTKTLSLCGLWRATTGTTMPSSFCEWIMGYEIGHTKLNALGIQWFQPKSGKHSNC